MSEARVTHISGPRLSKAARQERIVAELSAAPTLRASELASALAVSNETIRRDLMELDEKGLINRTYGGAARPFAFEPPVRERLSLMRPERERIASAVCRLFQENEVIMMGAGATTYHIARRLAAVGRNLTVIVHDFMVAGALCHNPTIRTLFLPGRVHASEGYVFGAQTLASINTYQVNWAVVGSTGIGDFGICDADDEAAAIYRAMTQRAAESIVAADHSKFGQPSLVVYAGWSEIDRLVTDQPPPEPLAEAITQSGAKIEIADAQDPNKPGRAWEDAGHRHQEFDPC